MVTMVIKGNITRSSPPKDMQNQHCRGHEVLGRHNSSLNDCNEGYFIQTTFEGYREGEGGETMGGKRHWPEVLERTEFTRAGDQSL